VGGGGGGGGKNQNTKGSDFLATSRKTLPSLEHKEEKSGSFALIRIITSARKDSTT